MLNTHLAPSIWLWLRKRRTHGKKIYSRENDSSLHKVIETTISLAKTIQFRWFFWKRKQMMYDMHFSCFDHYGCGYLISRPIVAYDAHVLVVWCKHTTIVRQYFAYNITMGVLVQIPKPCNIIRLRHRPHHVQAAETDKILFLRGNKSLSVVAIDAKWLRSRKI